MGNHSLQSYLERRTDEELETLLDTCIREKDNQPYLNAIPMILEIIQKRKETSRS